MLGTYEEVSCDEWSGTDGEILWNGSCMAGEKSGLWPEQGCPNRGANLLLARVIMQFRLMCILGTPPA